MSRSAANPSCTDAPDGAVLRQAFGRFATGVAFVTASVGHMPHGLIVSSFTGVSMAPPLVSFCPSRASLTWRRMRAAGAFDVHVLAAAHAGFVRRVAPAGADRFAEPLQDALAVLSCVIEAEHAAGDHWIVVGRVVGVRVRDGDEPLIHFGGALRSDRR
ncbi:flavin reductase family protein [Solirubrobacter taibaiensis]|nr:flavin reductase family protein [Solirubrobacter taibaiensis]